MKELIGSILFLSIVGLAIFFAYKLNISIEEESNKFKKHIGEKIVLGKDTLIVTDYSILKTNLTLNNGTELSIEYFNNIKPSK